VKTFKELFLEKDLSKQYDGFILFNSKTKKYVKYPYPKGKDNRDVEDAAIRDQMKLTSLERYYFSVVDFVPKGEFSTWGGK